jgi:phosphohistidine phosphatase
MKVFFLRHGSALGRDEWKGADAERPLTSDGIEKLRNTAETLAHLDLALDAIITSPLVRARQTAEIVAKKLGLQAKLSEDQRLASGFNEVQLHDILHEHARANAVMLVGHEPDLSDVIGKLIGGGRVAMKKGGLALVELPNPQTKRGELLWLFPPKWLAS